IYTLPGGNPTPFNVDWNKLRRARRYYSRNFLADIPEELITQVGGSETVSIFTASGPEDSLRPAKWFS
ncbi:hypothetical protein ACFL5K_01405, partial [Gemmatimonadota bacterium]